MERPATRISAAHLEEYAGKNVRLIGKVISLDGDSAVIETSDGQQVTIKLSRDANFADQYVEVTGRVSGDDQSIQEFSSVNMGNDLDMALAQKMVDLSQAHPEIFPTS